MRKTVCDLCGKEAEPPAELSMYLGVRVGLELDIEKRASIIPEALHLDLCKECYDKIAKFIEKNRKVKSKPKSFWREFLKRDDMLW